MNLKFFSCTFAVIFCADLVRDASSAKVLGLFAFPGKSHSFMYNAIMKELGNRGHEVTMITNFPIEDKPANYTEIIISPVHDFWSTVLQEMNEKTIFDLSQMSFKSMLKMLHTIGFVTTEYALQKEEIQALIKSDEKFDIIVAEQFQQEAFLLFAHKYAVPVVTLCTFGYASYMTSFMGSSMPKSFVPHEFVPFADQMTLKERAENALVSLYDQYMRQNYYLPKQDELARKYFNSLPGPLPSVAELEKQISLILVNTYTPLVTPRPTLKTIVEVGGVHIKPPKVLPRDIREFMDTAEYGVVLFSLGTNLKSSDLPTETRDALVKVFSGIKQRVIWKWEDSHIPNLPKNVMVKKWLPQSDILAHPRMRVFITHGGLLSTQEGVWRAVPMLGIPIYCDQSLNINKAVKFGYAVKIEFNNLTEASFSWGLGELLDNPDYAIKIRRYSKQFRDRPLNALDESIFWIEYALRHNGTDHLRSAAIDMPFVKYYLLDIIGVVVAIILFIFAVFSCILKCILRRRQIRKDYKKFK